MKKVGTGVAVALLLCHGNARAQGTCEGGGPAVALRGTNIESDLRERIVAQLRTTLAERKIALCEDGAQVVAVIDITPAVDEQHASITLTVRDAITKKTVSRDVELGGMPPDARPLLLAQSADELLRASWAEILIADAPKTEKPVPQEIARAVTPVAPRRPPVLETGVAASGEAFGGGHLQIGPDLFVAAFAFERVGARVRAGYRAGGSTSADSGVVDTTALTLGIGPVVGILPREGRFGLDAVGEILLTRATFTAEARGDAVAKNGSATAAYATLGVTGFFNVDGPLKVGTTIAAGGPLATVRVNETDTTIVALSGVLFSGQVFVGGAF